MATAAVTEQERSQVPDKAGKAETPSADSQLKNRLPSVMNAATLPSPSREPEPRHKLIRPAKGFFSPWGFRESTQLPGSLEGVAGIEPKGTANSNTWQHSIAYGR